MAHFQVDNRKYQVPADMGRCKVCIMCEFKKSLKTMEAFYFCREKNDFVTLKFKNNDEVAEFYTSRQRSESEKQIFWVDSKDGYKWCS